MKTCPHNHKHLAPPPDLWDTHSSGYQSAVSAPLWLKSLPIFQHSQLALRHTPLIWISRKEKFSFPLSSCSSSLCSSRRKSTGATGLQQRSEWQLELTRSHHHDFTAERGTEAWKEKSVPRVSSAWASFAPSQMGQSLLRTSAQQRSDSTQAAHAAKTIWGKLIPEG